MNLGEHAMNWADWTIIVIVLISCLISLLRGFVREALSLLSWGAATIIALAFHPRLAIVYEQWIETPSIALLLAFLTLFVGTLLIGTIVTKLLGTIISSAGLGGFDRILGIAFGVARGLLIVMAIVVMLPMLLPVRQDAWWLQSQLIPHFEVMEGWSRAVFDQLLNWGSGLVEKGRSAAVSGSCCNAFV